MGKCLKIVRYLGLDDWATNSYRRHRAVQSCVNVVLTLQNGTQALGGSACTELYEHVLPLGREVLESLGRGARALALLFGDEEGIGYTLAGKSYANEWQRDAVAITAESIASGFPIIDTRA
jgi:hypothetical protein